MNISEKIKVGREGKGWTQTDLSKYSGVSLDSIKRYESKESNITIGNLIKIADSLEVDLNFFRDDSVTKSLLSPVTKSSNACYLVEENENVHKSSISFKPTAQINPDIVQIPIYDDVVASAGGGVINDEYPIQSVGIDKGFLRTHFGLSSFLGLSIITAKGDSMSPTIPENCQLLVQKSVPKEGQICVVRIDDELYVKRLQKLPKYRLISDNKSYENIELEGREYNIVGVVVGFFKRMI